ncbi:diguanylate cyclase (GGDEF)-like protein [Rivibacter subsaxonicus]|uniref:diguanylate cyclase n=2 Tax=Rivibacter subsaxonicus TaxID=457575 RepID=A0A4Q7VZE2_9BURK|nr:diguanylate cyclase (GGDEF)-like protein [Rivibacter subsaxonicus]
MRLARRAWQLLHVDSVQAAELAERALVRAQAQQDIAAQGRAHLVRGYHLLHFATPAEAIAELERAVRCCDAVADRAGHVLARAGMARSAWRDGRFEDSLQIVLPLRDEGLGLLRNEQRSVLLNTIAGCYSAQGRSEQAFAYMYQALRGTGPARSHGFDVVLHCNLAHELLQIGDYHEALRHVDEGLARCASLNNARLHCVLLINRIICLIELDRTVEALPDIDRVCALPPDATGRGALAAHFETLAIAALHGGDVALGADLVAQAQAQHQVRPLLPEGQLELALATALLAGRHARWREADDHLAQALPLAASDDIDGLSLRVRCLFFLTRAEIQQQCGDVAAALESMRHWKRLHVERARLASQARYQAAALQTELLRLQHKLAENDAQRRTVERARSELQASNEQLSRTVQEVQALQSALREQASRDALTGLFNRRHLNDTLPAMWALAQRDRQPLAVAIIDLDHFKLVNDQHGHDAGDAVLAAFGRLLDGSSRRSDVACRWGGEEFCLLMPRTGAAAAQRKIAALLRRWRAEVFTLGHVRLQGLSFSAGVCDSGAVGESAAALLKAADEALLAAKREGRNRVLLGPVASAAPLGQLTGSGR